MLKRIRFWKSLNPPPDLGAGGGGLSPRSPSVLLITTSLLVASLAPTAFLAPESGGTEYVGVLSSPGAPSSRIGQYPPDTRLIRYGDAAEDRGPFELARGLSITSRPRLSFDGGRVLFSARRSEGVASQIWEVYTDGSGLRQITASETDCLTPDYLPDGRIVFARLGVDGSSRTVFTSLWVCPEDGQQLERITFGASFDLVEKILRDGRILIRRLSISGSDPYTLLAVRPDGTELESYLATHEQPGAPTQKFFFSLASRRPRGASLFASANEPVGNLEDVVEIGPRAAPPVATSVVDPGEHYGWLLCLNVHQSDILPEAPEVRVVRVRSGLTGESLGEAPVEEDGSFFLQLPADQRVLLEMLDESGHVIAGQHSGIWVRPNESRGCIGCHEPRNLAPENQVPLAIGKPPIRIPAQPEPESMTSGGNR